MDEYNNTFIQKSCNTFNKPPREWQVDVGAGILRSYNEKNDHNQLLIRKTGEGKSLVYLVTGACLGCVILCISPLLSLAMDQSRKVLTQTPTLSQTKTTNYSEHWIKYMAHHLTLADIDGARRVANRAFDRIEFRQEGEKLNVLTALLTLELKYGEGDGLEKTLEEGL